MPVLDFPNMILTKPPALKKYLAASALANVQVCVNVMVQADCPEPVPVVFDVAPVNVPIVVPEAAALPRLRVMVLMSVSTLAKIAMTLPVTGCVRLVRVEPVCDPAVARFATRAAHDVAVTVPPMLTVLRAVCPQPLSPLPVLQTALILLALALAKPL